MPKTTTAHANIADITNVLYAAGDMYYGASSNAVAAEWDGFGFAAVSVERWVSIGVWMPSVADQLDAVGLTPIQALRAARTLGGDAIYAACHGDLPAQAIIDAWQAM